MFQVKMMRTKDHAFATQLANTMHWNMEPEDFQFMALLEPKGCFVLFDGSKRVGIATCVSFGKVGWFGNLIVKEDYRHRGAGRTLVTHAVDYLHDKGTQTIGLFAYPHLTQFYEGLGFKLDEDFSVLHKEHFGYITAKTLQAVGKQQLSSINRLDSQCFGGDRKKLLESIVLEKDNVSYCISDNSDLVGYVAATIYETIAWIGPLVCQATRNDVANLLINAALTKAEGKSVYAVVSKKEVALLELFFSLGFKEEFFVSRMFLGEKPARNCIYLAESLERG
jgi:GNAT superfamily N-acetyltransferase